MGSNEYSSHTVEDALKGEVERGQWNSSLRRLALFFFLTVGTVALLATIRQAVVYYQFYFPSSDSRVINVAGRQRMLSQRLSKAALEYQISSPEGRAEPISEFRTYFEQWLTAHQALVDRTHTLNLLGKNSPAVRDEFSKLQPHFEQMRRDGETLLSLSQTAEDVQKPLLLAAVTSLLTQEDFYLLEMEKIVHLYEEEARQRVARLLWTDMVVYLVILAMLGAEGWFVLRPAIRRLREEHKLRTETEQELREAIDEAQAATRAKSEFLANTSHEIRTPMTAILGFTEVLLNDDAVRGLPQDRLCDLETIRRNGVHLLDIINDILDISKIEANKLELEQLSCQLDELLADIDSLMGIRARSKQLHFAVRLRGPIPETVKTDPTRLKQVLVNLINNAIKFTEKGKVTVDVGMDPDRERLLRFEINDTGIGMTPEQLGRLFEPFVQADSSMTRRFGGTGLGLAVSSRLIQMLGGEIVVTSKPEKGSQFVVTIPISAEDAQTLAERSGSFLIVPKSDLQSDHPHNFQGVRFLLAEDGPDNQRLIVHLLRGAGASVTVVENGQLAVDEAMNAIQRQDPFDVVLMDMQMPVLDGYEATRLLRKQGYQRPIIALTAHAMSGDRELCLDAGCDSFSTKPIQKKELFGKIEMMVEQARSVTPLEP